MPRRSVRNRKLKRLDVSEERCSTRKKERSTTNSQDKPRASSRLSTDSARGVEEVCCKCLEEDSPESEGKIKETWIDCDICGKWWHGACAKLSDETVQKLIEAGIKYSCAFCVIGRENLTNRSESLCSIDSKLDKVLSLSTLIADTRTGSKDQSLEAGATKTVKTVLSENSDTDKIVVVDGICSPREFRTSEKINKELSKFPQTQNKTERAYCLPQGGIALHLKESENSDQFIQEFPRSAFGSVEAVHQIKEKCKGRNTYTAYGKNIPVNLDESSLKLALDASGKSIKSVHRLKYSRSGRLLPVIRVTFQDYSLYKEVCSRGIHIPGTKQRITLFEPERRKKVVRCYNCHRFGHIGKACLNKSRCVNCGREDCESQDCSLPSCCANCGGRHKADSSHCPTFLSVLRKFRVYSILQNHQ